MQKSSKQKRCLSCKVTSFDGMRPKDVGIKTTRYIKRVCLIALATMASDDGESRLISKVRPDAEQHTLAVAFRRRDQLVKEIRDVDMECAQVVRNPNINGEKLYHFGRVPPGFLTRAVTLQVCRLGVCFSHRSASMADQDRRRSKDASERLTAMMLSYVDFEFCDEHGGSQTDGSRLCRRPLRICMVSHVC